MNDWKEAIERSKIPRVNYKKVLNISLTEYILRNKHLKNEEIMRRVLIQLRKPENKRYLNGIGLIKAGQNLRISLSSRRAEQEIYK